MADSNDKDRRRSPSSGRSKLAGAVIGLLVGELASSQASNLAKLIVFFWKCIFLRSNCANISGVEVFEVQLVLVFMFTMLSVVVSAWAAYRGWAEFDLIVLTLVAAILAVAFSSIENFLPEVSTQRFDELRVMRHFYHLAWAVIFLLFIFILSGVSRSVDASIRNVGHVVSFACMNSFAAFIISITCWIILAFIIAMIGPPSLRYNGTGDSYIFFMSIGRIMDFWVINPGTVAALSGASIAIFSESAFRKGETVYIEKRNQLAWRVFFVFIVIFWAGIYGSFIFDGDGMAGNLRNMHVNNMDLFFAFASFPVSLFLGVFIIFCVKLMSNKQKRSVSGMMVYDCRYLALVLTFLFGLFSWYGIGYFLEILGRGPLERAVLALVHAINGCAIGLSICACMKWRRRLLRRQGADANLD